jgi:hypothetical protein
MAKLNDIEVIHHQISQEAKSQSIEDGLAEIYQDDSGGLVDVQKLQIKRKPRWWVRLLSFTAYLVILVALAGGAYYYYLSHHDASDLELVWEGNVGPINGQDNQYILTVRNKGKVDLRDLDLRVNLPANFQITDSQPPLSEDRRWHWSSLGVNQSVSLKLDGRFYNLVKSSNLFSSEIFYKPENFSSAFKKTATFEAIIADAGIKYDIIKPANVVVGEKQTILIKYSQSQDSNLDNFRLTIEPSQPGNVELIQDILPLEHAKMIKPWVWQIYNVDKKERELAINFKVLAKNEQSDVFKISFDYWQPVDKSLLQEDTNASTSTESRLGKMLAAPSSTTTSTELLASNDKFWPLVSEQYQLQVIKNELSLLLIQNGSEGDQSTDFGSNLTYSLNFTNNGAAPLEDIEVTAHLDSDLLDLGTFKDKYAVKPANGQVSWTKNEMPDLAKLDPGEKGVIDFNLKVKDLAALQKLDKVENEFKTYVTFSTRKMSDLKTIVTQIDNRDKAALGDTSVIATSTATSTDNISNIIITKMNSDLNLAEQVLYYSNDNEALGSGPIPLEVGKATTLRVSWQVKNTLHNLTQVETSVLLPAYVVISGTPTAASGQISFDAATRRLTWVIPQADKGATGLTAEFNIVITPSEQDRNKLLIVLPPATIKAQDEVSKAPVSKEIKARTSKLEDDAIVQDVVPNMNGGLVK